MTANTKKKSIQELIGALVDKDGLKTELTIKLTNQTISKIVLALLFTGASIIVIAHLTKHFFPNQQLASIEKEILTIKKHLQ